MPILERTREEARSPYFAVDEFDYGGSRYGIYVGFDEARRPREFFLTWTNDEQLQATFNDAAELLWQLTGTGRSLGEISALMESESNKEHSHRTSYRECLFRHALGVAAEIEKTATLRDA